MSDEIAGTLLLDPAVIADPYDFYRTLREQAPVWRVPGTDVLVVSSFELVAEATSRVDDFSNNIRCLLHRDDEGLPVRLPFGDAGVDALATADPPDHTLHRGTVFPELVAKRMAKLESEITELAAGLIDAAVGSGSVDFMEAVAHVLPFTVISRLIGFRNSDPDRLKQAAFDSTEMIGATLTLDELEPLVAGIEPISAWIAAQLEAAADSPSDDVLGAVAKGTAEGVFGVYEGTIILLTLLSAGGESTTSLLGNAVRLLAEHPELQARLRDDPSLVPAFVEEALRLESPFRYLMRTAHAGTSLGGVEVPPGATLLLFWGAANRDPAEYAHPDEIDLDRRILRHHLAFGRGIHHCVGAPLARLEARCTIEALLAKTDDITLDPESPPEWANSLLVRRHARLPLHLSSSATG